MIESRFAAAEYVASLVLDAKYKHKYCIMFGDHVCASTDTPEEAVCLQRSTFRHLDTFVRLPTEPVPVAKVPVAEPVAASPDVPDVAKVPGRA
jgi:hypothetical protein